MTEELEPIILGRALKLHLCQHRGLAGVKRALAMLGHDKIVPVKIAGKRTIGIVFVPEKATIEMKKMILKGRPVEPIPLISDQAVTAAVAEVSAKSYEEIERDTAIKWGARYLAALRLGMSMDVAADFHHECIEHAAFVGVDFLAQIIVELEIRVELGEGK